MTEQLSGKEVRAALSHYGIADIRSAREFIGGDPRSPKALITCEHGTLLLKRRAAERADPYRVAFAQRVMIRARAGGVPAPRVFGTRATNNSLLKMGGRIYELFEFIDGTPYRAKIEQARDAGAVLARLHKTIDGLDTADVPAEAGGRRRIELARLTGLLERQGRAGGVEIRAGLTRLESDCAKASAMLDRLIGDPDAGGQLIHGDYHPGNLIFRDGNVAAVLDFDSARPSPAIIELAAALLHLSLVRRGPDPGAWPVSPDARLLEAAWQGYVGVAGGSIDPEPIPWLMIEAIADETVLRIAGGASEGAVRYAARVGGWVCEHADGLAAVLCH